MRIAIALFVAVGIGIGLWIPAPPPGRVDGQGPKSVTPASPANSEAISTTSAPPPISAPPSPAPAAETVIERSENGHYYATADVNGMPTRFLIDTGATTVALTVDDARRAGIAVEPSSFQVVGTGASGDVRGQPVTLDSVSLDGRRVEGVRGAVLEGLAVSLLGQTYLAKFDRVEISGGMMKLR